LSTPDKVGQRPLHEVQLIRKNYTGLGQSKFIFVSADLKDWQQAPPYDPKGAVRLTIYVFNYHKCKKDPTNPYIGTKCFSRNITLYHSRMHPAADRLTEIL
jgi:hypothetical protein